MTLARPQAGCCGRVQAKNGHFELMFSLDSFTSQSQLTLTIGNWTGYPNSKLQAESRSTVGLLNPIPFRYPNPTWTSV